jgi:HEAT repeat protein
VWEALLKVGDLSVVREIADYLNQDPPDFRPRDRILQLNLRVFLALCDLRDASVIPYLTRFMDSSDPHIRSRALMALREIGRLDSAPVFLHELDEHDDDMAFIAMQALFELAGGGWIDWVENDPNLAANAPSHAQQCRDWWSTEGEARARARFKGHSKPSANE